MSEMARWQQANNNYLAHALTWLRLLLEQQAQRPANMSGLRLTQSEAAETVAEMSSPNVAIKRTRRATKKMPTLDAVALVVETTIRGEDFAQASNVVALEIENISDEQLKQAVIQWQAAEATCDPPPALVVLAQRLGLSHFEREVLLLCAAMEMDTRIAGLCAEAQADLAKTYPTFALALALFDEPGWEVLSPERPLRYWRLLEITQPAGKPLTVSALRADERIVNYIKGLNYLDDRLAAVVTPGENASASELPPSQQAVVEDILQYWKTSTNEGTLPLIQLLGADSLSKQLVAAVVATNLGLHLYRLSAEMLPGHTAELETLARLWQRESVLIPLALYLDAQEADSNQGDGQSQTTQPLNRFLSRSDGVFFLGVRETWPRLNRHNLAVDVAKPTASEQVAVWQALVGEQSPDSPGKLAAQFNLDLPAIRQLAQSVLEKGDTKAEELDTELWQACQRSVRPRLDNLAQRIEPRVGWPDLVLPEVEQNLLYQIADQVGQRSRVYSEWGWGQRISRGLGINVLFAGTSGTGKTLAAEVLANHLRLNLYRIDLSAVVSKYIGETEKNLRRLFDAAEDGGVILFFDEADALFGKRSEVKDSHDRYANIEVNYLLQRMESYGGLAILATNMKSALDPAFMRRLRFVVNFPFPGMVERKRLWQKVFPAHTPLDKLDFERLARLNLTGGNIYNVALNAAFMAASSDTPVTMPMLLSAARTEFQKLDRPVNEAEFR